MLLDLEEMFNLLFLWERFSHEEYRAPSSSPAHLTFKSFVEDHGLEFFSIGGDPAEHDGVHGKQPWANAQDADT